MSGTEVRTARRATSWLLRSARLGLRSDRTDTTLTPLLALAVVLIDLRRLADHELRDPA